MALLTPELEQIIESGIDLKSRAIYFGTLIGTETEGNSEVSQTSVDIAVRAINVFAREAPTKAITLYMNSYGGDPYSVLYLIDTILACPCQIKFYGGGVIMSAAAYVMAVCDERYLYPNTTVMVHNGSFEPGGNSADVYIDVEENKRLDEVFFNILSENSFMPKSFWRDVKKRDLHLTAQETVQLGLADSLIKPKKRRTLRKKRLAHLSNAPTAKSLGYLVKRLYNRVEINPKLKELTIHTPNRDESDDSLVIDEGTNEDNQAGTVSDLPKNSGK